MADIGTQAIAELVLRIKAENLAGAVLSSLTRDIRALPLAVGAAAAGVAVAATKMATDYQNRLTQVANNTTMTASGIAAMDSAIKGIAAHSPASLDALALGWMHVTNFGYGAAAATSILDAAQKSAVSTGGDVAQTAELLAAVMHEFSIPTKDAAGAMDVLHLAAAQGNMTLEQFVEGAGPAIAMAANLHVPFVQAAAAISALTRHGVTPAEASTYIRGVLEHIVNPTKAAHEELVAISKRSGIDLLADFTPEGLKRRGLSGVLADIRAAQVTPQELYKIIPAIRGGLGAQILTGTGAADYTTILASLGDTMAGKTTPTADAYARSQATLAFQTGVLKNNLQELGITIGTALLPGLTKLVAAVVPIVQGVTAWASAHAQLIATATPIFIVLSTIAGLALTAGGAIGVLAAVFSPLSLAVMAIVAAIGVLSVAWATNWGGIQQKASAAWAAIQPAITQVQQALGAIGGALGAGGLAAAADALLAQAGTLLGRLVSWARTTALPALQNAAGSWVGAFSGWVAHVLPALLSALGVLVNRLASVWSDAGSVTGTRASAAWITAFVRWAIPAGAQLLSALGSLAVQIAGFIVGTLIPASARAMLGMTRMLWGWVTAAVPPLLAALGTLLGHLGAWIMGTALPAIAAQLGRWATAFWQWVGPATASLISHLGPLLDRLGGWIGTTALPAIGSKLAQWGTAFWHWIVVAMPVMQEKLGEFLGQMIVWIPTAAVALTLKLVQWGAAFIGWLLPRWLDLLGKLNTFLANIGKWIVTTALPALLKMGWDMGTQLIAGLVTGISDAAAKVHEAIQNALHGGPTAPPHPHPHPAPHLTPPPHPLAHPPTRTVDPRTLLWPFGPLPSTGSAASVHVTHVVHHSIQQHQHHHAPQRHDHQHRHTTTTPAPPAGTGAGAPRGGLSPATQAAIAAASGNAPKKETPAQIAAMDFSTAMALFKAQKGLDPADIARMRADIAVIARSDPPKGAHLQALLGIAIKHNHEAIARAGAVAAHHARTEAHQREQRAQQARRMALTDATDRFRTDLLTLGTSLRDHARLVADVTRIKADEIAAHVRGARVALDFAENMRRVNEHFKIAAAARAPVAPVPRFGALAGETGYGQTVVSFGGAQQSPWQAMVAALREQITHLRAQLAKDDQVIALLELGNAGQGQQLGVLRTIAGGIARIPVPPGPAGTRSAHSVLKAAGSYAPVTR